VGDEDTVVPFAPKPREADDGTINHFLAKVPGYPRRKCNHTRFFVDETNHEVTCRDCNAIVQPFDAMLVFANRTNEYRERLDRMRAEQVELAAYKPWLKAVKRLEGVWRGSMLPCCPHCHRGIEAEDLANGALINRSIATRLREVAAGRENGSMATPPPEDDGGGDA